jgi:hypothetical protein
MNTLDKYMEDEWNDHVAENMSNMISDYYMHPDCKSAIEEVDAVCNDIIEDSHIISRGRNVSKESCCNKVDSRSEATKRKETPVYSGFIKYFPDAINAIARCSFAGQQQHAPDQPLQWHRDKSGDEGDSLMRHLLEAGTVDSDGVRHSVKCAWRALGLVQKELELSGEAPLSKYNKL